MARSRGNAALIEAESLSPEETSLMEDNRQAQFEPVTPEPEPAPSPAPAVAKETTPAATSTPAATPEPADDKKRMVEYGALHEERERRKEERVRREKAEQEVAKVSERFKVLEELVRAASAPAPQQQQPIPDVNTDPVAHFQAELAARDQRISQFEAYQRQQQQQAQQQQQINYIRQSATQAEAEFAKDTPDYQEAATYVQMIRNAQLEAIGLADPAARAQQLAMEALNLAASAQQRGQNPAALIYNMAKASGWKAKAAEQQPIATQGAATPQAGAAAAPAAAAKKLETVARGQAANASLSQLNGSTATETSVETLLKMSDEDFAKATKGDAWRKLFS